MGAHSVDADLAALKRERLQAPSIPIGLPAPSSKVGDQAGRPIAGAAMGPITLTLVVILGVLLIIVLKKLFARPAAPATPAAPNRTWPT